MLSRVPFLGYWIIRMYVPSLSYETHTADGSHSELLHAAHRFGLAWYDRIDVNGSDHVIHCKMSSSGSLRDSWKPIGEFV